MLYMNLTSAQIPNLYLATATKDGVLTHRLRFLTSIGKVQVDVPIQRSTTLDGVVITPQIQGFR